MVNVESNSPRPLTNFTYKSVIFSLFIPPQFHHIRSIILTRTIPNLTNTMHLPSLFLATLAITTATAAELGIETTHKVSCTRKTTNGDNVSMHYRGTLQADGSEFDSSYKRNTPLSFKLGAGRVIKG